MDGLFPSSTFWDDMPFALEDHIDEAMDSRTDRKEADLQTIDDERAKIGQLFKIRGLLAALQTAIIEYDNWDEDDDDDAS